MKKNEFKIFGSFSRYIAKFSRSLSSNSNLKIIELKSTCKSAILEFVFVSKITLHYTLYLQL